jgi:hypothetical protein
MCMGGLDVVLVMNDFTQGKNSIKLWDKLGKLVGVVPDVKLLKFLKECCFSLSERFVDKLFRLVSELGRFSAHLMTINL